MTLLVLSGLALAFVGAGDLTKVQDKGTVPEQLTFAGGNGTVEDPYLIENVHQLQNMSMNLTNTMRWPMISMQMKPVDGMAVRVSFL